MPCRIDGMANVAGCKLAACEFDSHVRFHPFSSEEEQTPFKRRVEISKFSGGTMDDMKTCSRCKAEKPLTEFWKSARRGYQTYCKDCSTTLRVKWAQDNPESKAHHVRKTKYGLNKEQYQAMLEEQHGICALCPQPATVVDHDHKTGRVRGLLCRRCNLFLGYIEGTPELYARALIYLDH